MICKCARCGEDLTAPIFIVAKGDTMVRAYGYTCAKIVRPGIKKPKKKENWVVADSVATMLDVSNPTKRRVRATYEGKKYGDWHFTDCNGIEVKPMGIMILNDRAIINLNVYKR